MMTLEPGMTVRFRYTNHKLETEWREVTVLGVWWGASKFHQGEQWFLRAFDPSRNEERNFAMRDMRSVSKA